ncbi:MAG: ATP-binding protein [Desulfurococcales archaeon]|nr:ATP-binding protein [Desulfurococcales archaeon]
MSNSLEYLEGVARHYAIQAVRHDREGNFGEAIKNYRNAVKILKKIIQLYPDNGLVAVYKEWIKHYEKRIADLENLRNSMLPVHGESTTEASIDDLVVKEKPEVTFNDIADLEQAKEAIKEAILYPTRRPDLFPLGWPRGILLFGPPGCGKTLLAAAVANEIDSVFIQVDAASIMSKWLGEAEKKVALIFKKAREYSSSGKPVIIFIDEVDSLLGTYASEIGGEVRVRNQFLKEMDGLPDKSKKHFIYVIAATNKPWKLDEPFIRRFQKRIYVPLPDKKARIQLLELYTKKLRLSPDLDLSKLAEVLEGYTGSDIKDIVMAAHLRTVKELFEKNRGVGEARAITWDDFMHVLKVRKPSVSEDLVRVYDSWYSKFKAI